MDPFMEKARLRAKEIKRKEKERSKHTFSSYGQTFWPKDRLMQEVPNIKLRKEVV